MVMNTNKTPTKLTETINKDEIYLEHKESGTGCRQTDFRLVLESRNSSKRTKKDALIFDTDVTYIGEEISQRTSPAKLLSSKELEDRDLWTKQLEDWWTKQCNPKSTYKNTCEVCQGKGRVEDFSGTERFCFMCSDYSKKPTEIIKKKWYEFGISELKAWFSYFCLYNR